MKKVEYLKMFKLEDSHFWFIGKRFFVKETLSQYQREIKRILDLGSGTGGMTNYLKEFGSVIGIEKNPLAVKLAKRRGLEIKQKDINQVGKEQARFDLITLFDVLYHKDVKSESEVLKNIKHLLRKNGLVLITDSAFEFLKSKHDTEVRGKKRYRLDELSKIVKASGFKVLKKSYIYLSIFPIVLIKRKILDRIFETKESDVQPMSRITNFILTLFIKIESIIFKYISFPFGLSVLILARKKGN